MGHSVWRWDRLGETRRLEASSRLPAATTSALLTCRKRDGGSPGTPVLFRPAFAFFPLSSPSSLSLPSPKPEVPPT